MISSETFPRGGWGWGGPLLVGTAVGVTAASAARDRGPEYDYRKDAEAQRREIRSQIAETRRELNRNPNDKDLKAELRNLRKDLRNVRSV